MSTKIIDESRKCWIKVDYKWDSNPYVESEKNLSLYLKSNNYQYLANKMISLHPQNDLLNTQNYFFSPEKCFL